MVKNPKPFNPDPKWIEYCLTFDQKIKKIVAKWTKDAGLKDDCYQEALIALCQIIPEKDIKVYAKFRSGEISREQWEKSVDAYCRTTIRNHVDPYLRSQKTGCWHTGRTRRRKQKDGSVKEVYRSALESLDGLTDSHALQIGKDGTLYWNRSGPGHIEGD